MPELLERVPLLVFSLPLDDDNTPGTAVLLVDIVPVLDDDEDEDSGKLEARENIAVRFSASYVLVSNVLLIKKPSLRFK